MPPKADKRRKYKGFGVLNRDAKLIWGTLRKSAEEAQSIFENHNPDGGGEGIGETLVEVEIYI
ncbi:MAG: hypothetical protein GY755_24325, partial [Chloroflexi bacterium]|nr:hypothetical protein [Chloroflexota bacterium]